MKVKGNADARSSCTEAPCRFPASEWKTNRSKRELANSALAIIGEMADANGKWQIFDACSEKCLPFLFFDIAYGRGCELVIYLEQGGIAHWRKANLSHRRGQWQVASKQVFLEPYLPQARSD